jgi:hypothetical protein
MIKRKTRTLAGVMLRSGSTYREVADALEISVGSVHKISRDDMDYLEPLAMEMKRRSAYRCYLLADHALSRISDDDFREADLRQKSVFAGILFDKAAMLDGIMPRPDAKGWDEGRPGEMGRLYWPGHRADELEREGRRLALMELFMRGQDEDARRIGRTAGIPDEEMEEYRNWQEEFESPSTREEAREWKKRGELRQDFDDAHLPEDEAEKKHREKEALFRRNPSWFKHRYGEDAYNAMEQALAEDGASEESAADAVENADTASSTGGESGDGGPEAPRADSPAPQEADMRRVLNERLLRGLKAKLEMNKIEQAVQAQLDEKYGKIPGTG